MLLLLDQLALTCLTEREQTSEAIRHFLPFVACREEVAATASDTFLLLMLLLDERIERDGALAEESSFQTLQLVLLILVHSLQGKLSRPTLRKPTREHV